jgi:hypothetical protein
MANNLYELILMADIYGSKPVLKVGKLESFKTNLGSSLTIISILTILLALVYFSLDLFSSANPKIVLSIMNIFNPPKYHLSSENYGFAFGLEDSSYNQYVDETIYQAKAYQKTATRVQVGNSTQFQWDVTALELGRCSIDKFPSDFYKLFGDAPLNDMYCLKNNTFDIEGTFLNDQYSFLYIELYECKNSTDNIDNPCKPKDVIDEALAGAFFSFSHTDITIDPRNFTDPNQKYNGDSYTTISNKYFKEMHHYVKQVTIETDKGFLLMNTDRNTYLQDDYIKEMIDFRQAPNFLSYTFKLSTVLETYNRSYKKVQNVAAEVGGIIELISIACIVISYFYNRAKFYEFIMNELYFTEEFNKKHITTKNFVHGKNIGLIEDTGKENTAKNLNNDAVRVNNYLNSMNKPSSSNVRPVNLKTSNDPYDPKEYSIYTPTIVLSFIQSFFFFLVPCCFRKGRTLSILKKGQKEVDGMMDILHILKKLGEIDRIKQILLDETQKKVFDLPFKNKLNLNDGRSADPSKEEISAHFNMLKNNNSNRLNAAVVKTLEQNVYRILNEIPLN